MAKLLFIIVAYFFLFFQSVESDSYWCRGWKSYCSWDRNVQQSCKNMCAGNNEVTEPNWCSGWKSYCSSDPNVQQQCKKTCAGNNENTGNNDNTVDKETGGGNGKLSQEEKDFIVKYHNEKRAEVNPPSDAMMEIKWLDEGEDAMITHLASCRYSHQPESDRATSEFQEGGQNIYKAWPESTDNMAIWKSTLDLWYNEIKDFTYGQPARGVIGHYTQMVWGGTQFIGCSRKNCGDSTLTGCNYYPAGNRGDQTTPYRKSEASSCKGCAKNGVCKTSGKYKGIFLESCDLICADFWSNCEDLKNQNQCDFAGENCAQSCLPTCQA